MLFICRIGNIYRIFVFIRIAGDKNKKLQQEGRQLTLTLILVCAAFLALASPLFTMMVIFTFVDPVASARRFSYYSLLQTVFEKVHTDWNPYPADQNFRLLHLPPNSTKVLFHMCIHTLPTVTKLYPTISSYTGCQAYQKSHKSFSVFIRNFLNNFQS